MSLLLRVDTVANGVMHWLAVNAVCAASAGIFDFFEEITLLNSFLTYRQQYSQVY